MLYIKDDSEKGYSRLCKHPALACTLPLFNESLAGQWIFRLQKFDTFEKSLTITTKDLFLKEKIQVSKTVTERYNP